MSTDQPTLTEFNGDDTRALHERVLEDAGAAYGPSGTAAASAPQQAAEDVCLNCGGRIPSTVARVLGDNNGCVPGCANCREDVLDDANLSCGDHRGHGRVVKAVRAQERGISSDNSAGGRR